MYYVSRISDSPYLADSSSGILHQRFPTLNSLLIPTCFSPHFSLMQNPRARRIYNVGIGRWYWDGFAYLRSSVDPSLLPNDDRFSFFVGLGSRQKSEATGPNWRTHRCKGTFIVTLRLCGG